MAINLGLEESFFEPHMNANMSATNFNYYPPVGNSNSKSERLSGHSDFGMLTILKGDGKPGLEIQWD